MNKQLETYLEQIEKALNPLPLSERVDIVQELKSEIMELEGEGLTSDAIMDRLGSPRELARGYLGDSIAKDKKFSWKRLGAVLAFSAYAGIGSLFVLPVSTISAVAFQLCGFLIPIAGIVKFAAKLLGHEIPQIQFVVGSYSAGAYAMLPICLVLGWLCMILAQIFWRITVAFVRSVRGRKT